jgi:hypothetical protein
MQKEPPVRTSRGDPARGLFSWETGGFAQTLCSTPEKAHFPWRQPKTAKSGAFYRKSRKKSKKGAFFAKNAHFSRKTALLAQKLHLAAVSGSVQKHEF